MALSVTIDLPESLESRLRSRYDSFDRVATEAVLVDLYRRGELTHAELARALGVHRLDADGILKSHGVLLELTPEAFAAELAGLRDALSDDRHL